MRSRAPARSTSGIESAAWCWNDGAHSSSALGSATHSCMPCSDGPAARALAAAEVTLAPFQDQLDRPHAPIIMIRVPRIGNAIAAVLLAAAARADTTLPPLAVSAEQRRELDDPTWIAVDADDLVIVSDGALLRLPRRGGGAPVAVPQAERPIYAVSDGESLFWTAGHDSHYPIYRMPKSG